MGRKYFFYFAVLLTIAAAVGSLISIENGLDIGGRFSDKMLHAFGYFTLAVSWLFAFRPKIKPWRSIILIASAVFIYGIIIEILQGALTDYRQADLYDIFANFSGIAVATIFFALVFKKK